MNLFNGRLITTPIKEQNIIDCCDHEYDYHEDTIGDYGVINGTYTERWLTCELCGHSKEASWEDVPDYSYLDYM